MKKLIVGAFIGWALLAFTGCTQNTTKEVDTKCSGSSKCEGATKQSAAKTEVATTKCDAS